MDVGLNSFIELGHCPECKNFSVDNQTFATGHRSISSLVESELEIMVTHQMHPGLEILSIRFCISVSSVHCGMHEARWAKVNYYENQ
jgi:hypothetical protein